jgi:hypothetical protein
MHVNKFPSARARLFFCAQVSAEPVDMAPLHKMHAVMSQSLEQILAFEREYGAQVNSSVFYTLQALYTQTKSSACYG